jgi:chromosome segregation ATPase
MILDFVQEPFNLLDSTGGKPSLVKSIPKNTTAGRFKEVRSEPSLVDLEKEYENSTQHLNIDYLPVTFHDDCWYTPSNSPRSNNGGELIIEDINNYIKTQLKSTDHLVPSTTKEDEKSEVIMHQGRDIINMQITYQSLNLKYEGLKKDLENFKKIVADHIKDNNEKIVTETRRDMKGELLEKQHTVAELTHELNNYKEVVKSLRSKLNESNKEITAVEESQTDIDELKETLQKEKERVKKMEEELNLERERNNKLTVQIKELIQRCDKYTQREKKDESNLIARSKQLKEDLIILKRENSELRHQTAEWQSIVTEYEKHSASPHSTEDSIKLHSILQTLKEQVEVLTVNFFHHLIG